MADDTTEDPTLKRKLDQGLKISDEPWMEMAGSSKVKNQRRRTSSLHRYKELSDSFKVSEPTGLMLLDSSSSEEELPASSQVRNQRRRTSSLHRYLSDSFKVSEPTGLMLLDSSSSEEELPASSQGSEPRGRMSRDRLAADLYGSSQGSEPRGRMSRDRLAADLYGSSQGSEPRGRMSWDRLAADLYGSSQGSEPRGRMSWDRLAADLYGSSQQSPLGEQFLEMKWPPSVSEPGGLTSWDHLPKELSGSSQVKEPRVIRASVHPIGRAAGPSKVKKLTKVKLRGESPIEFKLSRNLNDVLLNTRTLHVFASESSYRYRTLQELQEYTTETAVFGYRGQELRKTVYWKSDGSLTYIIWRHPGQHNLQDTISALAPLCQAVGDITVDHAFLHEHTRKPFISMISVFRVCLYLINTDSSLQDTLLAVSDCFPNVKNLVLYCDRAEFSLISRYHSDTPMSSLRRLEVRNLYNFDSLCNLFLSISFSCQNIESLTVTSYKAMKWDKSNTAIEECKLPNLNDFHLQSRPQHHYALQMITNLLLECRMISPSLEFVKVESVQLGGVVMKCVEWSRTSSDFGLQIKGASGAVPVTDLIDLTTSDLKEVVVLTFDSCKIDFSQSESQSRQSPKNVGTLREIRFLGSENPLSESDRNKLSKMYPHVKVTDKQESRELYEESQKDAGILSKLDKALIQPFRTSSMGNVETAKRECCKRVGVHGGTLQLESFGIELEIPPGAIDSKEPQEISLRVLTDTPNLGDTNEEMSVCFGVQCLAPGDLVVRSPVTYTIPHCAATTRYSSLKAVLYTGEGEYSPHAVVKERKVLSRSGIPSCNIMKDVLELKMDHFSWAKIKIWIKSFFFRGKRMCCWPFKQMNLPLAKTPVILHAHLYDDLKGNKKVVREDEEELGFTPAHIEQNVFIKKAEVDLEMGCYVKKKKIGEIAVVSFDRLTSGTRICEPFELDFSNHPDSVAVSLRAGQTKELEVKCLFPLDFPILQKAVKATQPDTVGVEHGATSLQAQQTSEGTLQINPARERDFDDIMKTVAKMVVSRSEIHDLGSALGFGPEDIDPYVEENKKEAGVSYMGTLSMLRRWRKNQTKKTELEALQTALEKAGQIHLADDLFGE
ncbi:uncharacterized protein LOC135155203 isoform X4 [Lytechinus pictus]|uniref:uncharacterized protein LOC135155203 isoform X4 n=1 Tax=Lytechinus pictus TaxID=7653 RepID=UPI0030B9C28E